MPLPRQLRPVKSKLPRRLEGAVLKDGLAYLALLKIPAIRVNVGMIPNGRGGFRTSTMRGVSDVIAIVDGMFLALEAKSAVGAQSEHQRKFQSEVERGGGVYAIFRCTEDVSRAVEKARNLARGR